MNQNEIRQRLVHCLITYRQNNFHSQKLMARLCNLSLDYYISIERGISLPSLASAFAIAVISLPKATIAGGAVCAAAVSA